MRGLNTSAIVLMWLVKCSYSLSSEDTRNRLKLYDLITDQLTGKNYKLMYNSANWTDAVDICSKDGGHMAVPRSQMEFDILQKIVRKMYYPAVQGTDDKLVVWLGISNLNQPAVWGTVHGEDIESLPFHTWALGNGGKSEDPREPHCVVIDAVNVGLRDYWCHKKQPFLCEYTLLNGQTN